MGFDSRHGKETFLCYQSLLLFQLNAHNMLTTYSSHQLPPTCFGVCYTIFRDTICSKTINLLRCCKRLIVFLNNCLSTYKTLSELYEKIINCRRLLPECPGKRPIIRPVRNDASYSPFSKKLLEMFVFLSQKIVTSNKKVFYCVPKFK